MPPTGTRDPAEQAASDGSAIVGWWPRPRVVLACIVAAGAALRIYRVDALSLWLDEGITVHVARLGWATVLGLHGPYETHPPFYFVLVKFVTLAVPELHAARLVSVVAGTATIPVLYTLGTRILGTGPALVASAALALSPLHIWYSREARMYALSMLLVTASYLALVAFYRSPRRLSAVVYGVLVLLAMYTNYGAIFTLVPQLAWLFMAVRRHGRAGLTIWGAGVVAAVAYLPWLPALLDTTSRLGTGRQSYLGVSFEKVWASLVSLAGVGGAGSYFWGSQPTPWERWSWAPAILLPALVLTGLAAAAVLARRRASLAVVAGFLPGTVVVAAILSLVSPGYADRTVLAGVVGWTLALGALVSGRLPIGLKAAGWGGAIVVAFTSLLTLRAIYSGDKQHWAELASHTAVAARLGPPVWAYPTYSGTLIDVYQPDVFDLARPGAGGANRVIADAASAPSSTANAIWLAYIEAPGIQRVHQQLLERNYERLMHRHFWHPLYLDLYAKVGVTLGREVRINGRFTGDGAATDGWHVRGGTERYSEDEAGGRIMHLGDDAREVAAVTSAPGQSDRLYVVGMTVRRTSPMGRLRAFLICASDAAWLEVAPDGDGASVEPDGRWHRTSIAALCPAGTERVIVDIRNAGSGELMIRDVVLRELAPPDAVSPHGP